MTQSTDVLKQTPGRKIGPYRADQVGSLLRSEPVKSAPPKANGEISAEQLREVENEEIKRIVEKQKKSVLKP